MRSATLGTAHIVKVILRLTEGTLRLRGWSLNDHDKLNS
jgi:hypothetical protein